MIPLLDGPPLDPDSGTAREWLAEELSKPAYHTEPSLWDRFARWLVRLLEGNGPSAGAPSWVLGLILAGVVIALGVVLARTLRRDRRHRAARPGAVLDDVRRDAAAYRRSAALAAERGDHDTQLLDSYRAIAAGAVERTLLTDLPGRTAREVALELTSVFPDAALRLTTAAADFDAVRYGGRQAGRDAAQRVSDLDGELARARPVLVELPAEATAR